MRMWYDWSFDDEEDVEEMAEALRLEEKICCECGLPLEECNCYE